jgi:hypothetical protein
LKIVAEISGIPDPQGLALDASGNLCISHLGANGVGTNGIPVFTNDDKTHIATLMDPYDTVAVAVAAAAQPPE